jgi:hypothetical protein
VKVIGLVYHKYSYFQKESKEFTIFAEAVQAAWNVHGESCEAPGTHVFPIIETNGNGDL